MRVGTGRTGRLLAATAVLGGCANLSGLSGNSADAGHEASGCGLEGEACCQSVACDFGLACVSGTCKSTGSGSGSSNDGGSRRDGSAHDASLDASGGSHADRSSVGSDGGGGDTGAQGFLAWIQSDWNSDWSTDTSAQTSAQFTDLNDGDVIVVAVGYGGPSSQMVVVQDGLGNTYNHINTAYDSAAGRGLQLFYASGIAGGASDQIIASFSPPATYVGVFAAEYSGTAASGALVGNASTQVSMVTPGTDDFKVTVNVTAKPAVLFAFAADEGMGEPISGFNAGSFLSAIGGGSGGTWNCGANGNCGEPENQFLVATGPTPASFSVTDNDSFLVVAAAFAASGATP